MADRPTKPPVPAVIPVAAGVLFVGLFLLGAEGEGAGYIVMAGLALSIASGVTLLVQSVALGVRWGLVAREGDRDSVV
jgi:hypothetical protein